MIAIQHALTRFATTASIACFLALSCFASNVSAQTRAALVRDTDNPALAPVTFFQRLLPSPSAVNLYTGSVVTVPAGKRFVVQHITYSADLGLSSASLELGFISNASASVTVAASATALFPINPPHAAPNGRYYQDASFPMTFYFEAGSQVTVAFDGAYTSSDTSVYVSVTGYYVTP